PAGRQQSGTGKAGVRVDGVGPHGSKKTSRPGARQRGPPDGHGRLEGSAQPSGTAEDATDSDRKMECAGAGNRLADSDVGRRKGAAIRRLATCPLRQVEASGSGRSRAP